MIQRDPAEHVTALLSNLRLLEAAGACELVGRSLTQECALGKPRVWWEALAATARSYRLAIYATGANGLEAIHDWADPVALDVDAAELADEKARLAQEYLCWLTEVVGGRAYVAWLAAYVAAAEMDGERAIQNLEDCAAIAREFVDVEGLDQRTSVYDFLQGTANSLPLFLPLTKHPLEDLDRFALLPAPLRNGYDSAGAVDIQSHRGAGDPRPHRA